jgi:hypothetical protein
MNTTVTFSESTTPASGSDSISSPGPGMARENADKSKAFSFDDSLPDGLGFFDALDEFDLIELEGS